MYRTSYKIDLSGVTIANIMYALGDPIRFAFIKQLLQAENYAAICSELAESVGGIAPSTCSHHLTILRNAGLIHSKKQGVKIFNTLRKDEIEKHFPHLLENIFKHDKS